MNNIAGKTDITDDELKGNERIEEAISSLQKEPSQEMLAHTLTVIRRRMNENGQFVVAVEPPKPGQVMSMQLKAVKTGDGKIWWTAFTSFDEELKGADSVMSTFMTDIRKLFVSALEVDDIEEAVKELKGKNIQVEEIRIDEYTEKKFTFFNDPDGLPLELYEK